MVIYTQNVFDIHSNSFIHSKAQNLWKPLSSFGRSFICNTVKFQSFQYTFVISSFPNLESCRSLRRKVQFIYLFGIWNSKQNEALLSRSFKTISEGENSDKWSRNTNNLQIQCTEISNVYYSKCNDNESIKTWPRIFPSYFNGIGQLASSVDFIIFQNLSQNSR